MLKLLLLVACLVCAAAFGPSWVRTSKSTALQGMLTGVKVTKCFCDVVVLLFKGDAFIVQHNTKKIIFTPRILKLEST